MSTFLVGPVEDITAMSQTAYHLHTKKIRCTYSISPELRTQIGIMIDCHTICLVDGWWTDRNAVCLQTLAAWLGMKVIDGDGNHVPTSSLKG